MLFACDPYVKYLNHERTMLYSFQVIQLMLIEGHQDCDLTSSDIS